MHNTNTHIKPKEFRNTLKLVENGLLLNIQMELENRGYYTYLEGNGIKVTIGAKLLNAAIDELYNKKELV